MDFARSENLLEFSKGGQGKQKGNVYAVNDAETKANEGQERRGRLPRAALIASIKNQECKQWAEGTCVFGKKCHRKHVGAEGANKRFLSLHLTL